ncbi:MAG: hypothetical protein NDF57_03515 [archaeon GBS-70-058]|nr:hypothetical protein [Candidatus Culexarchaeum nevadense]
MAIASKVLYPASISFCSVAGPTPGRSAMLFTFFASLSSPLLWIFISLPISSIVRYLYF